jgi:hypothetical protein
MFPKKWKYYFRWRAQDNMMKHTLIHRLRTKQTHFFTFYLQFTPIYVSVLLKTIIRGYKITFNLHPYVFTLRSQAVQSNCMQVSVTF